MIAIGIIFDITRLYLQYRQNQKEKSKSANTELQGYDNQGGVFGTINNRALKQFVGKWRATTPIGEGVEMGAGGNNGVKCVENHCGVFGTESTDSFHKEGIIYTRFLLIQDYFFKQLNCVMHLKLFYFNFSSTQLKK